MRRLFAWIGGAVGGIAAYRFVRRQEATLQTSTEPAAASSEPDGRAEELRAKLAESRGDTAEPAAEEPTSSPEPESPEERRRHVHEEGRAALDEMRSE
ncbi:MAG TPA: hypothetical protein VKO84_02745 [Gaiellaceae bacterium]|nr:hypothetical protein [Gaiellaceae bacterium]